MKVVYEYSHLGGSEIMKARYPQAEREVYEVIGLVETQRTGIAQEKTMPERNILSPGAMNERFAELFHTRGYQDLRDRYAVFPADNEVAISGACKQVHLVKDRLLLEVQFRQYEFMLYDMAKFQYFFNEGEADVGVEIVPCDALHKQMSSGVSRAKQRVYDIERLKRHFPVVPVKVILIEAGETR